MGDVVPTSCDVTNTATSVAEAQAAQSSSQHGPSGQPQADHQKQGWQDGSWQYAPSEQQQDDDHEQGWQDGSLQNASSEQQEDHRRERRWKAPSEYLPKMNHNKIRLTAATLQANCNIHVCCECHGMKAATEDDKTKIKCGRCERLYRRRRPNCSDSSMSQRDHSHSSHLSD